MFGSEAFIGSRTPNMSVPLEMFRSQFQLPLHAQQPLCSIEILGYIRLGQAAPFHGKYRHTLIMGEASLKIENSVVPWSCFFRPAFDSWRKNPTFAISMLYFCPVPPNYDCNQLPEMDTSSKVIGFLSMTTHNTTWEARIDAAAIAKLPIREMYPAGFLRVGYGSVLPPVLTACLAITYETSHEKKKEVNGAIVYEWVRYYATLGFNVMIYDKNGGNRNAIFNEKYGLSQNQHGRDWLDKVDYHPYTVFGLITGDSNVWKYDNTKFKYDVLFFDDDKTATLTHCRFEASTLYGSDNVLVADFDEFLYCPSGALNFAGQQSYINSLVTTYRANNVDELVFLQMWVVANLHNGKYDTLMDCLSDHVNRSASILECFGSFKHNNGIFFLGKSFQLGHKCPITNFHNSCHSSECQCLAAYSGMYPFMKTMPYADRCYFIHLSTNPKEYSKYSVSNETLLYMANHESELTQIINTNDDSVLFVNHDNGP